MSFVVIRPRYDHLRTQLTDLDTRITELLQASTSLVDLLTAATPAPALS